MADGPAVFVSDLHLRGPEDPNQQLFLEFLERRIRPRPSVRLVVAGDLFDFWYGLPDRVPEPFRPVVAALESLPFVTYIEGNHDVRLARALGPESRIAVVPGDLELQAGSRRIHVEHGDHVDRADAGHIAFKRFMLSKPAGLAARVMGERALQWLGETAAVISRGDMEAVLGQDARWLEAARSFGRARASDGYDLTVLGHGHWLGWWPENLICLGDWLVFHSYLEVGEDGASLRRYRSGGDAEVAQGPIGSVAPD